MEEIRRRGHGGRWPTLALSLFLSLILWSCSDDDGDDGAGGSGGTAGQSGSPGGSSSTGNGGAAGNTSGGKGGSAGTTGGVGGTSNAGSGGSAGQSSGGAAGDGGTSAGQGGSAGGGGGSGGAPPMNCIDDFDCEGFSCCDGQCVNRANDPFNCGMCGGECEGDTPFCAGSCVAQPCSTTCDNGETCCGGACCGAGEICCMRTMGAAVPECVAPVDGTCPLGCADCD